MYLFRKTGRFTAILQIMCVFPSYPKIGKTIPTSGTGFQIRRSNSSLITQSFTYLEPTEIDTFYTKDGGVLYTSEKLKYDTNYSIVKVATPYGYVLVTRFFLSSYDGAKAVFTKPTQKRKTLQSAKITTLSKKLFHFC